MMIWKQQQMSRLEEVLKEHDLCRGSKIVQRLFNIEQDENKIADILVAVFSTCHYCWDNDAGCHCWNDE